MKEIFPASRHKSVIGYTEPLGKRILELEDHWIEQLHTQTLAFERNKSICYSVQLGFLTRTRGLQFETFSDLSSCHFRQL